MPTPATPRAPHAPRPQLTAPVAVDSLGMAGPTPRQARGPHWRRVGHGLYVPTWTPDTGPNQRVLEASCRLPARGAVTGWAALSWLGASWHDGTRPDGSSRPVDIATGMVRCRPGHGVAVSQERLAPEDVTRVDGVRVTLAARSVLFEMRYASSLREAVVALDMAAIADLVTIQELAAWCERHAGWTGIPQARQAVVLADENSWSPAETRMRLAWMLDAGLPRPRCNVPVFDNRGRFVAVPDLLDEEAGLAVEYDGAVHLEAHRRRRDLARERALRSLGLECLTVVAGDAWDRRRLATTMLTSREQALTRASSLRLWTTDPPDAWYPSDTVALRALIPNGHRRAVLPPGSAA